MNSREDIMGSFKVRQNVLAPTSVKIGANGTQMSKLLVGTVAACVPAMAASTFGTGSAYIAGLETTDGIVMQLNSLGASGVTLASVRITAANTASLTFMAGPGPTTACTMVFGYVAGH
jgi:hypothetical protein